MKITLSAFSAILRYTENSKCEVGGLLGGNTEVIHSCFCDLGTSSLGNVHKFYPNVRRFNSCIKDWNLAGIDFYGIFHSHTMGIELSNGDIRYIKRIMDNMPHTIDELFFPIIVSGKMIGYKAYKRDSDIVITEDDIVII